MKTLTESWLQVEATATWECSTMSAKVDNHIKIFEKLCVLCRHCMTQAFSLVTLENDLYKRHFLTLKSSRFDAWWKKEVEIVKFIIDHGPSAECHLASFTFTVLQLCLLCLQ